MGSIGSTLAGQAISISQRYIPKLITRQIFQQSRFTTELKEHLCRPSFSEMPIALEKAGKGHLSVDSGGVASRKLDARRIHAFKADAPKIIDSFLNKHCGPHMKEMAELDTKIAQSWWPKFTFRFSALKIGFKIAKLLKKINPTEYRRLAEQILEKPKKIETSLMRDLQEQLNNLRYEHLKKGSSELNAIKHQRGVLLRDFKESIQQLKLNEANQAIANAKLTKLACDSIKLGRVDTIQLLKEAGADPVAIGKTLVNCKLERVALPPSLTE